MRPPAEPATSRQSGRSALRSGRSLDLPFALRAAVLFALGAARRLVRGRQRLLIPEREEFGGGAGDGRFQILGN